MLTSKCCFRCESNINPKINRAFLVVTLNPYIKNLHKKP
jgi:hypothetical protein